MSVLLIVLAAWCALSVLFAGAHYHWVRYADVPRPPIVPGRPPDPFVPFGERMEAVGSDVSSFFGSYAGEHDARSAALSRN